MASRNTGWRFGYAGCRTLLLVTILLGVSSPGVSQTTSNRSSASSPHRAPIERISAGGRTAAVISRSSSSAISVTAIRNLEAAAWLERLEIEVENIANEPVYCLIVLIVFPDLKTTEPDGLFERDVAILLKYGRLELLRAGNFAAAGDTPIRPGESYVFRIPDGDRGGLENKLAAGDVSESAVRRLAIMVDTVIFADGTGFKSGLPFPR